MRILRMAIVVIFGLLYLLGKVDFEMTIIFILLQMYFAIESAGEAIEDRK